MLIKMVVETSVESHDNNSFLNKMTSKSKSAAVNALSNLPLISPVTSSNTATGKVNKMNRHSDNSHNRNQSKSTKSQSLISNSKNDKSSNDDVDFHKPIPLSIVITTIDGKTQLLFECSSLTTIFDIRTFLLEQPVTCHLTNYQLEFDRELLNDMSQLIQYPNLIAAHTTKHSPVIFMRREYYDERSAKLHFRRLREILVRPPREMVHSSVPDLERERWERIQNENKRRNNIQNHQTKNKQISSNQRPRSTQQNEKSNAEEALAVLNLLSEEESPDTSNELTDTVVELKSFPFTDESPFAIIQCLQNINYSCWNPPNGNRRLRGDLIYVEVVTLEGSSIHVTASLDGWFVNRSNNRSFDGHMADKKDSPAGGKIYHSLCDLIKKVSPMFETRFNDLLSGTVLIHPFESLEVQPSLVTPDWLLKDESNRHVDWNQAEDYQFVTLGVNQTSGISSLPRDWNEEIASTRELPKTSFEERVTRFKHLQRIHTEFIEACRIGVKAVVDGNIPPINPLESQRAHVFIFNSIFFSYANDAKDVYNADGIDGDGQ